MLAKTQALGWHQHKFFAVWEVETWMHNAAGKPETTVAIDEYDKKPIVNQLSASIIYSHIIPYRRIKCITQSPKLRILAWLDKITSAYLHAPQ